MSRIVFFFVTREIGIVYSNHNSSTLKTSILVEISTCRKEGRFMNLNEICSIYRVFGWGKSNYTFNVELGSTRTEIKALGGSLVPKQYGYTYNQVRNNNDVIVPEDYITRTFKYFLPNSYNAYSTHQY